jgi:PhnB protein
MSFDPYLHFMGNCADAMAFYADLFGADQLHVMRYREAPEGPPEFADSDLVMHATLVLGNRTLMASDYPPGMDGLAQQSVSISHIVPDTDRAHAVYDALCVGGAVIMAFGPTFFSEGFGMVQDRFGTHWMIGGPMKDMA